MEVKPKALESKKIATKAEHEKKTTKNDDMMMANGQDITIFKGHLKIIECLNQAKTRDYQSPKSSRSSSSSSSSSYMMKIKMANYKNSIRRSENTNKNKKVMNQKQNSEETNVHKMKNKKLWDCESTLYDSFELNSFNRQLDSAISSSARSISMPHLPPPPPPTHSETTTSSPAEKPTPNKISRSLQKLIKSMFRHKQSNTPLKACDHGVDMDKYCVVFNKNESLTTIPESADLVDSEINSLVRKTVSERFRPSRLVGISCS